MEKRKITKEQFEKIRNQALNQFIAQQDDINQILKKNDFILIDKESLKVTGKQPGRILENVLVLAGVLEALLVHQKSKDLEIPETLIIKANDLHVDLSDHARKLIEKFTKAENNEKPAE